MTIVARKFHQQLPDPQGDAIYPKPLCEFFACDALIVLGDPGAGKTTSFEQAASEEPGAIYITIRDFLSLNINRWTGKTLYLDGLDEQRSKTTDGTAILDNLRQRLDELNLPRFRLSCRSADWYGTSDLNSLKKVVQSESITVVSIEPLSEADIVVIATGRISDPALFLEEAHRRGVDELLTNPQTLDLILTVVGNDNWPSSRTELFEKACEILLREENIEHDRSNQGKAGSKQLFEAAGYLCAVVLCGGLEGISLSSENADDSFPYIGNLEQNAEVLHLVAQRRLFKGAGPERRIPLHRTVSEFLAASYLKERISNGLPIGRIKSILTGFDGGTLSDLRGVYAWLVCLCPQFAASLIPIDPLGILLYGDARPLLPSTKKTILSNLQSLAKRHPWFLYGCRDTFPFGALSCHELIQDFRKILADPDEFVTVKSCVIDAIQHGVLLPELGNDLIVFAHDSRYVGYIRRDAIIAYHHVVPDKFQELIHLLNKIQMGVVSDKDHYLRGVLLQILYPEYLPPARAVTFIVKDSPNVIAGYSSFLNRELVEKTCNDDIPTLIEAVIQLGKRSRHEYSWGRLVGRLVNKGLNLYGEAIDSGTLYKWLSMTLDEHRSSLLREEEKKYIRSWLEKRPYLMLNLLEYSIKISPPEKLGIMENRYHAMILGNIKHQGLYKWLFAKAEAETDQLKAEFYFSKSVYMLFSENENDKPTLDNLYDFAEKHPRFKELLKSLLQTEIADWHIAHIKQQKEWSAEKEKKKIIGNKILTSRIDLIRDGSDHYNLNVLANIYNGFCIDSNNDLSPYERLIDSTNPGIASVALEGFQAILYRDDVNTPYDIAMCKLKKEFYNIAQPLLIGMRLISIDDPGRIFTLPNATIKAAIAFHYEELVDKDPSWLKLIIEKRPMLASEAFLDFWKPQLKAGSDNIAGIYELDYKPEMAFIAGHVATTLLTEYPNCPVASLEHLLWAALLYAKMPELLSLTINVLGQPGIVNELQRILWMSTGFLIDPDKFGIILRRFVGKDKNRAYSFLEFVTGSLNAEHKVKCFPLDHKNLGMIIYIVASVFPPFNRMQKTDPIVTNAESASRTISALIDKLSGITEKAAGYLLNQLISRRTLILWHDNLLHALAIQQKNCREAAFRYPTAIQLIDTIRGGKPANLLDLKEVVLDHLKTLRDEIRNGPLDGYKNFWNLDSYGRATEAIPENDCRDRLLGWLKPILLQQGVQAEPEGHFAEDKRADIKVLFSSMVLPIEIKRHYHKDVWTAPEEQLHKRYSRDPGAAGHGIYLVFWFGIDFHKVPKPPSNVKLPITAEEMEEEIRKTVPGEMLDYITIIVFDCSRPN